MNPLHDLNDSIKHWCLTPFLEGHSSAQFCSNPNQTHLMQLIKVFSDLKLVSSTLRSRDPPTPGFEIETFALKGRNEKHFINVDQLVAIASM